MQIQNGQPLPADVVVLGSSEEEGICYVETSQIDGETNLKLHRAPKQMLPLSGEETKASLEEARKVLGKMQGRVDCEAPNLSINTFTGIMKLLVCSCVICELALVLL
jgi:phospholipid-transporting ATPase